MWLEHLLFGACPEARRAFGVCVRGSASTFSLFCILQRAQLRSADDPLRGLFIDNTERKDQRGKEKQKESLYNLEFRSFFELKNIGTAISRQEQIRNDSQPRRVPGLPRGVPGEVAEH